MSNALPPELSGHVDIISSTTTWTSQCVLDIIPFSGEAYNRAIVVGIDAGMASTRGKKEWCQAHNGKFKW